jgi:hypothetical protein
MFRLQRHRLLNCAYPLLLRLTGHAEHQVEVDVLKTGIAQDFIRALRLLRAVNAAEHL